MFAKAVKRSQARNRVEHHSDCSQCCVAYCTAVIPLNEGFKEDSAKKERLQKKQRLKMVRPKAHMAVRAPTFRSVAFPEPCQKSAVAWGQRD
jgi:hypothetical protein